MIVLNVLEGTLNAELGGDHRNVLGRARQEARVEHVLDHGHRAEPEPVPRTLRVIVRVDPRLAREERVRPGDRHSCPPSLPAWKSGPKLHDGLPGVWMLPNGSCQTPSVKSMYSFQNR